MVASYDQAEDWKQYYFWGVSKTAPSALSLEIGQMQALLGTVRAECAIVSLAALEPKHLINHKGTTAWILLFVYALMNEKEALRAVAEGSQALFMERSRVHGAFGAHVNWPASLLEKYHADFGDHWPFVIPFARHRESPAPMQLTQSLRSPSGAMEIMGVAEFSDTQPEALLALFHQFSLKHGKDFAPAGSFRERLFQKLFGGS
jgi:hypothetical protein